MRLEIEGNIALDKLEDTVLSAFNAWMEKIEKDNPEIKDALANIAAERISKISLDIQFQLDGLTDWKVLTTDNHSEIPELLVIKAETDEDGKLLLDTVVDNDENSNFNDVEAIIASGVTSEDTEIESKFADEIIADYITLEVDKNIEVRLFTTLFESVVQVYKDINGAGLKLTAETTFPMNQYESLVEHYKELSELNK